jgi:B12 binding domain
MRTVSTADGVNVSGRPIRILLSGVFGPFGVDDAFGRKENIMELFHNQVTRGQDTASFRFFHRSFGLYFLAANVDADVTVLDFPSKERFEKEVGQGYDLVGISFIAPNFTKAREMARITRRVAPGATIVLGGHGAAVEGVAEKIDCDHVVRGEGIRPLRRLLGQDPDAPIVHPTLPSSERSSVFGLPAPGTPASLLVPGVGCVNGCRFCSTSHFFEKNYTPYLSTGRQMFETARRIADETGTDEFFVMDENFLKDKQRALDLIDEMERHERYFSFHIFSSTETIRAFGLHNLERLNVTFVWIGVESSSSQGNFEKNDGLDARQLISQLQARGVIVLASAILCAEHHTPDNIQTEIDFMIGLEADFVQFMLLTPLPVTALYKDHKARGLLRMDLPLEEWHGQKELSFRHPAFPGDAAQRWIDSAFRQEYEANSSSLLRVIRTVVKGYERLDRRWQLSAGQESRKVLLEQCVRGWAPILPAIALLAVNRQERERALDLARRVRRILPPTLMDRLKSPAATALAVAWRVRVRLLGDSIQPVSIVTQYPAQRIRVAPSNIPVEVVSADVEQVREPFAAVAMWATEPPLAN